MSSSTAWSLELAYLAFVEVEHNTPASLDGRPPLFFGDEELASVQEGNQRPCQRSQGSHMALRWAIVLTPFPVALLFGGTPLSVPGSLGHRGYEDPP